MRLLLILCLFGSLYGAQKFDWGQVLSKPPPVEGPRGNQILHFKSKNKPYTNNEAAVTFVQTYLAKAVKLESDAAVLKYGSDHVTLKGVFIELGVCTGKTINFLAALNPQETIYGFDSFEGLPEDWARRDGQFLKGTFAFKNPDMLPPVLHNVELIKGWFSDTLPTFVQKKMPIALLHIDSDIYSSAATAFEILGPHIQPGTIIVFDELYNYMDAENHEWKAFQEFLSKSNYEAEYLAYNVNHEQVAVRIRERNQGS